jgi:hypothetical protein
MIELRIHKLMKEIKTLQKKENTEKDCRGSRGQWK